jgi:hypothetical protein
MTQKELQIINLVHWINNPLHMLLFAALAIWTICWKGAALWKAAQNSSKIWFIILLVVNTLGILEIIYIFFFSKKNKS